MRAAGKAAERLQSRVSSSVTGMVAKFAAFGVAILGVKSGVDAFTQSLKLAAAGESMQVRLELLTGSSEAAKALMVDLEKLSAATPFQLGDLQDASALLLAVADVDEVVPIIKKLGNIAAATGSNVTELASAFQKVRAGGKADLVDLNKFGDRGIKIFELLGEVMGGKTVIQIKKMISAGQIGAADFEKAIDSLGAETGRFGDAMERMSQTTEGKWSTMKDNITLSLKQVGKTLFEVFDFKGAIDEVTKFAQVFTNVIKTVQSNWTLSGDMMATTFQLAVEKIKAVFVNFFTKMLPELAKGTFKAVEGQVLNFLATVSGGTFGNFEAEQVDAGEQLNSALNMSLTDSEGVRGLQAELDKMANKFGEAMKREMTPGEDFNKLGKAARAANPLAGEDDKKKKEVNAQEPLRVAAQERGSEEAFSGILAAMKPKNEKKDSDNIHKIAQEATKSTKALEAIRLKVGTSNKFGNVLGAF